MKNLLATIDLYDDDTPGMADGGRIPFDNGGEALSKKEIIKEATGDAPSIKKAGGGIARMLGE